MRHVWIYIAAVLCIGASISIAYLVNSFVKVNDEKVAVLVYQANKRHELRQKALDLQLKQRVSKFSNNQLGFKLSKLLYEYDCETLKRIHSSDVYRAKRGKPPVVPFWDDQRDLIEKLDLIVNESIIDPWESE